MVEQVFDIKNIDELEQVSLSIKDLCTTQNIFVVDGEMGAGKTTLISDKSRVIKGGSWADRAFWLSPGARRWMNEDVSSRTVGFRCTMTRVGSPSGNKQKGGNIFSRRTKRVKRRYK